MTFQFVPVTLMKKIVVCRKHKKLILKIELIYRVYINKQEK